MFIKRLSLENYCQYPSISVDFHPGVNIISARNGIGKSNLIKAIYAAISNDFGRNAGVKADNIRWTTSPKDVSSIYLEFEHNGVEVDVIRGLQRCTDRLIVTDPRNNSVIKELRGSDQLTKYLQELLGISQPLLANFVFVDQGAVSSFLSMTPTERAKALQQLFGTVLANRIYDIVGKNLFSNNIPPELTLEGMILEQKKQLVEEVKDLTNKLAEMVTIDENYQPCHDDTNNNIIDAYKARIKLISQLESTKESLNAVDIAQARAIETFDSVDASFREYYAYLNDNKEEFTKASNAVTTWETYDKVLSSTKRLDKQIETLRESLTNAPGPAELPDGYITDSSRSDFEEAWAIARNTLTTTDRFLHAIAKPGLTNCPTCNTPVDRLQISIEEQRNLNNQARDTCNKSSARWRVTAEYNSAELARKEKIRVAEADLRSCNEQLALLPTISEPDISLQEAQTVVDRYKQTESLMFIKCNLLQQAELELARTVALVAQRQADLEHIELELNNNAGNKEAAETASDDCVYKLTAALSKRDLITALGVKEHNIKQINETLAQIEVLKEDAAGLAAWTKHAENIQAVLHHNALPKLYSQTRLELLEDDINDLLTRFESDFRIKTDEGLTFIAEFWKGKKAGAVQTANRLSGGEKVLLAMAFRISVNAMFAKDVGLLVLDEPTAGLDDVNLGCVNVAFERLRELSRSRGLQVIMVTHEKQFVGDKLIELE